MKLEGFAGDRVFASGCRNIYAETDDLEFQQRGRLPKVQLRQQSFQRFLQTGCYTKAALARLFGSFPTVNIWPIAEDRLFASRGRMLYRSTDGAQTWTEIYQLPSSSGPMGVLPTGFAMEAETILLGEYPLDESDQPRVMESQDGGTTWKTVFEPEARHVHAVTIDPYTGDRWITTGDGNEEAMIARLFDDGIDIVGSGSQLWRAVDIAFTPDAVLWGMDCPYVENNRIVRLSRDEITKRDPTVKTVHVVGSPVYFAETVSIDGEHHVLFSTAIEPATTPKHTARVVHGTTADGFKEWDTLVRYERASPPFGSFIDTNAYVFIAADSLRGVFVNPYNTATENGSIQKIPLSCLRQHED